MQHDLRSVALQLAVEATGHPFLPHAGLASPAAATYPKTFTTRGNGFSFFLLDVTKTEDGKFRLIEANGSNGAATSAVTGNDAPRAKHMSLSFESKPKPGGRVVTLSAYQPGFLLIPEFFGRAGLFAEFLSHERPTNLRSAREELGDEVVSVVCDSIPNLADHIEQYDGRVYYKNRPVVFATNPNLLAELARRGVIGAAEGWYDIDTSFFHEGQCTPLVHDKGTQQEVAAGTGITPLDWEEGWSLAECAEIVKGFHARGQVAVAKMNAGSGGAGIEIIPPSRNADTFPILQALTESARQKYGGEFLKTVFPIRIFEFARSTGFLLGGRAHLWDMRVQCLVYPGRVEVTPCVIRLCPEPFDEGSYARDCVVSNRTGRTPSMAFIRSALDQSALRAAGLGDADLALLLESCAKWCEAAWARYSSQPLLAAG